ncbi:hypothetical protein CAL7716_084040 [Calothrix sp. PCC 7716]|nr:hypothetical protein CAL7716_084040 [Calothrix sp. PCC 7716]
MPAPLKNFGDFIWKSLTAVTHHHIISQRHSYGIFFIYTMNLEKLIKIFKFEVRYNTECIGMFVLNGAVYGYL